MPQLQALYSPGFLADRAPDAPTEAASAETLSLAYCPERHGTPADFARHPDFCPFRAAVERDLEALSTFAAGASSTVTNLATWRSKLFDIDDAGNHLQYGEREAALMYGDVARGLARLSRLIRDDRLSLATRRLELDQLAPQLTVCAGGVVEALHCCLGRLDPARNGLPGLFRSRVEQMVEQVCVDAVETEYADVLYEARLDQRHHVAGLKRKLYDRLELPWHLPEDPFVISHHADTLVQQCTAALIPSIAPESVALTLAEDYWHLPEDPFVISHHADTLVQQCTAALIPSIAPESVALTLAEDYLQRFTCALHQRIGSRDPVRASSASSEDARALPAPTAAQLDDCLLPLGTEFGPPPPATALLREREDGQCECLTDATLVAAYFLDVMGAAGSLASHGGAARTIAALPPPSTERRSTPSSFIRSRGDLVWVEDRGLRRPFDAEDLTRVPPGELRTSMVRTAVLNSSPALLARMQASPAWSERLQALWDETRTPTASSRPVPGRLSWADETGSHTLAPSQITRLLERREPGEPLPPAAREELGALLALTLSLRKPERGPRGALPRTRAMPFVQPLRLWWGEVGSAMRADPPRLNGDELLEVLLAPLGNARPPLVQAMMGAHRDLVHVLLEGLTELRRDGLLRGERLFERLAGPDTAVDGLPALMAEFGANALGQLLRFALLPAGDDRLSPSACRALLLGPAQEPSSARAVPPVPRSLIERSVLSGDGPVLRRYVEAAIQAAQRKLFSPEDLRRALDSLPAAATATRLPESGDGWAAWTFAVWGWYATIVEAWLKGEISEEDAAAALAEPAPSDPAEASASRASASSAAMWEARLNTARIRICTLPRRIGEAARENAREQPLRRHMLDRLAGLFEDVRGLEGQDVRQLRRPCRAIRSALDAGLAREAADCARQLQSTMESLAFSQGEIAAAIGNALGPASAASPGAANCVAS